MTAKSESDADAATSGARGTTASHNTGGDHDVDSNVSRSLDHADIGVDEAHSGAVHDQTRAWNANVKRTYDAYQTADLDGLNTSRSRDSVLFQLSTQALQNAVETSNMVAKQAVRHSDLAIDREWNVDEVAALVAKVLQTMQPTTAKT